MPIYSGISLSTREALLLSQYFHLLDTRENNIGITLKAICNRYGYFNVCEKPGNCEVYKEEGECPLYDLYKSLRMKRILGINKPVRMYIPPNPGLSLHLQDYGLALRKCGTLPNPDIRIAIPPTCRDRAQIRRVNKKHAARHQGRTVSVNAATGTLRKCNHKVVG